VLRSQLHRSFVFVEQASLLFAGAQLIHIAARNGHSELLEELLKRGARINSLDFVRARPPSTSLPAPPTLGLVILHLSHTARLLSLACARG